MSLRKYLTTPMLLRRAVLRRVFKKTNRGIALYTAFPKSASNHILDLMRISTNSELRIITPKLGSGFGHNFIDQEKIYESLFENCFKQILIYGHIPFHAYNDSIIKWFGSNTKILVSLRPLPDIVISYKEHIDRGKDFGPLDYRIPGLQECNQNWPKLSNKRKYDYIINFILPWYIRYVVSWFAGAKKYSLRFTTFEEHILYPYEFVVSINKFLHIQTSSISIKEQINSKRPSLNFNVGQRGRGYKLLSQEQMNAIQNLLSFFGDSFLDSNIGKYLLYGYDKLEFDVADVIDSYAQQKDSPEHFRAVSLCEKGR